MRAEIFIGYAAGLASLAGQPYDEVVEVIRRGMPSAWLARYQVMCGGHTNVLVVAESGFEYLLDHFSELIAHGELPRDTREDRTVAAFGVSTSVHAPETPRASEASPALMSGAIAATF